MKTSLFRILNTIYISLFLISCATGNEITSQNSTIKSSEEIAYNADNGKIYTYPAPSTRITERNLDQREDGASNASGDAGTNGNDIADATSENDKTSNIDSTNDSATDAPLSISDNEEVASNEETDRTEETISEDKKEDTGFILTEEKETPALEPISTDEATFIASPDESPESSNLEILPKSDVTIDNSQNDTLSTEETELINEEANVASSLEEETSSPVAPNASGETISNETSSQAQETTSNEIVSSEIVSNETNSEEATSDKTSSEETNFEDAVSDNENANNIEEYNETQADNSTTNEDVREREEGTAATVIRTEEEDPAEEKEEAAQITPSRKMDSYVGQYIDITYPGKNWVYLGESNNTAMVRYLGRKVNAKDTSFSLKAKDEGNTILHFYKIDALASAYIDDYIEVKIYPASDDTKNQEEHSTAPEYNKNNSNKVSISTESLSAEIIETGDTSNASPSNESALDATSSSDTDIQTIATESISNEESEKLLLNAQNAYNNKNYEECLSILSTFFNQASSNIDEGMFLQGLALEAPSSKQNIKAALDTYETLVKRYPQSKKWKAANERIIYLERFYFTIR